MCLNDSTLKVYSVVNEEKDFLAQAGTLSTSDLIAETIPPQGFSAESFNGIKLKPPSFIPPNTPPSIDRRQADNPRLSLRGNDWESKKPPPL